MLRLTHPEMAWGLLLVAVPLVIHLINRLRQRRVEWAAMEFLLDSQRKHRTSVRLRELLLLLARMAAVAGIVLLLARPTWRPEWAAFGGSRSHQIVLLDDSFSMTDRGATASTFERAREALGQLGDSLARDRRGAALTVARTSAAPRDEQPWRTELARQAIDDSTRDRLAELALGLEAGQTAVTPATVLEHVGGLISSEDRATEVWLLTDCRRAQWTDDAQLTAALSGLQSRQVVVHVVDCAERPRPNAAVSALEIPSGVRVAAVPLRVEVEITNYSDEALENVVVEASRAGSWQPVLTVERIEPGRKARKPFHWTFAEPGAHTLAVRLPVDAVAADNTRFAAVEVVPESPALILDDDPRGVAGKFLALALSPGGRTRTGLAPRVEPSSFLNSNRLDEFSAVYLANVRRLDGPQREALTRYLADGGGVGVFLGPETDLQALTADHYQGGQGWFPLPLSEVRHLAAPTEPGQVDVRPDDLELFRIFAGERNSFLQSVRIERYAAAPEGWTPKDRQTRILARLRDGAPLVVERRAGPGRVVAFLTTAAPDWNDWGRNPSFVVTLLELHARLAQGRVASDEHRVGQPLEVVAPVGTPPGMVRFTPPEETLPPVEIPTKATPEGVVAVLPEATRSGVYRAAWLTAASGATREQSLAVNVDPAEGDLQRAELAELRSQWRGRAIDFAPADGWRLDADLAGWQSTQWFVLALLGLLAGEQWLARRAGYHPLARQGGR